MLLTCNLYTTEEHQHSLVHLQCTNCISHQSIDCLWFTPCSVLWTTRRSRGVPTEYEWRLLMTTWWITSELAKMYFSTLKDIQLFSTGSHCCAQLVSFWLRAMDSPWEPNCTQHDSTDRYAIGNRKWYDQLAKPCSVWDSDVPNDRRPLEKPMGTT